MAETAVTAPAAPTPEATPAPVDPNAPKAGEKVFEIKYPDGRIEKRGESWIQERAQKSIGLEKRVSDAAKYEQAFNNFVAKVQNPSQLLELLNHPDLKYDEEKQEALITSMMASKKPRIIEAVKRWIYENEVKPSLMDPKDRELMEWKNKADVLESDKLKREKELREVEEANNVAEIKEAYRVKLGEAFVKSGLPSQDYLVRQVLQKAQLYTKAGKHPDFENCCKLVQAEFIDQVKMVLGSATVDNILGLLDGETPKKINQALMKAIDKKDVPPKLDEERSTTPRKREKERTPQEKRKWLKNLERGIVE